MNKKKGDKQGRHFKVSIFYFNLLFLHVMLCVWALNGSNWG